jgi:hypothetical protein
VSCDKKATDLLNFLNETYASGNAFDLRNKYDDFRMFSNQTNAVKYLSNIDELKTKTSMLVPESHQEMNLEN